MQNMMNMMGGGGGGAGKDSIIATNGHGFTVLLIFLPGMALYVGGAGGMPDLSALAGMMGGMGGAPGAGNSDTEFKDTD